MAISHLSCRVVVVEGNQLVSEGIVLGQRVLNEVEGDSMHLVAVLLVAVVAMEHMLVIGLRLLVVRRLWLR